jgi:hypothetical protein
MQIATFVLQQGQVAQIRYINLNVIRILTPGVVSDAINSTLGLATVGVYGDEMICSPFVYVTATDVGCAVLHPYTERTIVTPGTYSVKAVNNTGLTFQNAVDLSIAVTGVVKLFS